MPEVLVLGATGYTGRLVCEALDCLGADYEIAGRNPAELEALSTTLAKKPRLRLVDVRDDASLDAALAGVTAVANTVGPFVKYGARVVQAAIRAGAHYVDTTAEQSYQHAILANEDEAARQAGIAVITAQACDFAPSYLAGHLLHELLGPVTTLDSWHWLDDYKVSKGTAKSALGMLAESFTAFRNGRHVPMRAKPYATRIRFPFEMADRFAVPFPGGDTVLLPHEIASLRAANNHLTLPMANAHGYAAFTALGPVLSRVVTAKLLANLERAIDNRMDNPDAATRKASSWTVVVRGRTTTGTYWCRVSGKDVYGATGILAAKGALDLARFGTKQAGVVSTGAAFAPRQFLDELRPHGIRYDIFADSGQPISTTKGY